jgi:hypothetical protein
MVKAHDRALGVGAYVKTRAQQHTNESGHMHYPMQPGLVPNSYSCYGKGEGHMLLVILSRARARLQPFSARNPTNTQLKYKWIGIWVRTNVWAS